jgi:hypothetical protein
LVDGICKPRDVIDKPTGVVVRDDCATASATNPCFPPPPSRDITVTANTPGVVSVDAQANDADHPEKIDRFVVEARGGGMLAICVRRILGVKEGANERLDIAMRYCFKLLKVFIQDVTPGQPIDSITSTPGRVVDIGSTNPTSGNSTVRVDHEESTDANGKRVKLTLRTWNQIAEVICHVSERPRNQDGAALRPSSAKCGLFFRVPPQFYTTENSRICFTGSILIDVPSGEAARADMRANTDANGITTVNVFPKNIDGTVIQSLGSLTLDSFATVGDTKATIKYTVDVQNSQIVATACIMVANPDIIWIDPEFSTDDSTYSESSAIITPVPAGTPVTPSGSHSSAVSMIASVALVFAAVLVALLF